MLDQYRQIQSWVFKRYAFWQEAEDLVQYMYLEVLSGRKSSFYYIAMDFMRKLYGFPSLTLDDVDMIQDLNSFNEDDIITKVDKERHPPSPPLQLAQKSTKKIKTKKKFTVAKPLPHNWKDTLPVGITLAELKYVFVYETLRAVGWNRTWAAMVLGISLRGLKNMMSEMTALGYSVPQPSLSVSSKKTSI